MWYASNYKPNWRKFLVYSCIVHILLLFTFSFIFTQRKLEFREKTVNITIKYQNFKGKEVEYLSQTKQVLTSQAKKLVSREEVNKIMFEITSPKISKSVDNSSTKLVPSEQPTESFKQSFEFERKLPDNRSQNNSSEKKVGLKSEDKVSENTPRNINIEDTKGEKIETLSSVKGIKSLASSLLGGSVKWEGPPREVIDWYEPNIPPDLVKSKKYIVMKFFILPNGFVSRLEVIQSSGDSYLDNIIYKTMKKIRFRSSDSTTIAIVSFTISPR